MGFGHCETPGQMLNLAGNPICPDVWALMLIMFKADIKFTFKPHEDFNAFPSIGV